MGYEGGGTSSQQGASVTPSVASSETTAPIDNLWQPKDINALDSEINQIKSGVQVTRKPDHGPKLHHYLLKDSPQTVWERKTKELEIEDVLRAKDPLLVDEWEIDGKTDYYYEFGGEEVFRAFQQGFFSKNKADGMKWDAYLTDVLHGGEAKAIYARALEYKKQNAVFKCDKKIEETQNGLQNIEVRLSQHSNDNQTAQLRDEKAQLERRLQWLNQKKESLLFPQGKREEAQVGVLPQKDEVKPEKAQEKTSGVKKDLEEQDFLAIGLLLDKYEAEEAQFASNITNIAGDENEAQSKRDAFEQAYLASTTLIAEQLLQQVGYSREETEVILKKDVQESLSVISKACVELMRVINLARKGIGVERENCNKKLKDRIVKELTTVTKGEDKPEKTPEEAKQEPLIQKLDELIADPKITPVEKKRRQSWKDSLLSGTGDLAEHIVNGMTVAEFIDFLLVGREFSGTSGSYDKSLETGLPVVGEEEIVDVYGEGPDGAVAAFQGMEQMLLRLNDSEITGAIQSKSTKFVKDDGEFSFDAYKTWLTSKFKLKMTMNQRLMLSLFKEQLLDGEHGRKAMGEVKLKDENGEIKTERIHKNDAKEKIEELVISQEALDQFLKLAKQAESDMV